MTARFVAVIALVVLVASVLLGSFWKPFEPPPIVGVVIPHHNIVREARREFLIRVANRTEAQTIILVSPNHRDIGSGAVQVSDESWSTVDGVLSADMPIIEALVGAGVSHENESFTYEHGVTDVVGDIAYAFPHARVVPLILKSTTTPQEINALHDTLSRSCAKCLLIASVDFSHYQVEQVGDLHDVVSVRALLQGDMRALYEDTEVDSPAALALLALWSRSHDAPRFEVVDHTNSGALLPAGSIDTTTHVLGYYTHGVPVQPPPSLTFMIGGDTLLGRNGQSIMSIVRDESFEPVARFCRGVDVAVLNLEGAFSKSAETSIFAEKIRLLFEPHLVGILKALSIDAVGMANNHAKDGGEEGVAFTEAVLADAGIVGFGHGHGAEVSAVHVAHGHQIEVAFIAINALEPLTGVDALIHEQVELGRRVVIFVHWGREYESHHSPEQESLAHALIDLGADMVVGSHPHVVQDVAAYKGRPIIYSLGNFLFDQQGIEETTRGMVVGGVFRADSVEVFLLPVESGGVPRPYQRPDRADIIASWNAPWESYRTRDSSGNDVFRFELSSR